MSTPYEEVEEKIYNVDPPPAERRANIGSRTHSPDKSVQAEAGANVNSNHFTEHSKLLPWLMLCAVLSGFAVSLSIMTLIWASITARESRVLQQQVMDQSALLLREGIRQPGDETNGPSGNTDYHKRSK